MRVAIIGSRGYPHLDAVEAYVRSLPAGTVVVTGAWWEIGSLSGGADARLLRPTRGVDRAAAEAAARAGLVVVLAAGSPARGKAAGLQRNPVVVDLADEVTAFWDMTSPGTKGTIDLARERGVPVRVFGRDGELLRVVLPPLFR